MSPSLSGVGLGERDHSLVDEVHSACKCQRETEHDSGIEMSMMNGLIDEDPLAEPLKAIEYGDYIKQDPYVPVSSSPLCKYEDTLHKPRSKAPLVEKLSDNQAYYNDHIDSLASPEVINDGEVFSEILGRPLQIENARPLVASILDNEFSNTDSGVIIGFYGEKDDEMIGFIGEEDELKQWHPERHNAETQHPDANAESHISLSSGVSEPEYWVQQKWEQELAAQGASDNEQSDIKSDGDEPEESEQELEEDSELGFDDGGYESNDLEAEHPILIHDAGEWQKRLLSGQSPSAGPVKSPSEPVHNSPYATHPVRRPQTSQSSSADGESKCASESPEQRPHPSPSPAPQDSWNQMPGRTPPSANNTAGGQPSPQPHRSPPTPVRGSLRGSRVITAMDVAVTRALSQMQTTGAALLHGTSIFPFVAPQPASAIASFVLPTPAPRPAPTWATFVAPSPASVANPAGYAAAHALIARTPFRSQGKHGPYAIRGQDKGDFLAFVRNGFVGRYFRQFHPTRSFPHTFKDKNDWYIALPPWEQDRVRGFIQKNVEAELPEDVAAEVKRLREGASTMPVGSRENSGLSAAVSTRIGVGALPAMTTPHRLKARQNNPNQQVAGENATVDLQNVPEARMQDLADLDLRLRARGDFSSVQSGYIAHQPYFSPQPSLGSGYQQETPHQGMTPCSGESAHQQHAASMLNAGAYMTPPVMNDGTYSLQQTQFSTVIGSCPAGFPDWTGTMYPLPDADLQSPQLAYQSEYQDQGNSVNQNVSGAELDDSDMPNMHDAATTRDGKNDQHYRREGHAPGEMAGTRLTSGFGGDNIGVLHTKPFVQGSKRKHGDDDGEDLVNSEAKPMKLRRS